MGMVMPSQRLLHHVLKPNHSLSPPHHPTIRLLAPFDVSSHLYLFSDVGKYSVMFLTAAPVPRLALSHCLARHTQICPPGMPDYVAVTATWSRRRKKRGFNEGPWLIAFSADGSLFDTNTYSALPFC